MSTNCSTHPTSSARTNMAIKRPKYLTPQAILGFASIKEPDTKFADPDKEHDKGSYKAMLRMDKEDPKAIAFVQMLQEQV